MTESGYAIKMRSARSIVRQWGRWISSGLVAALLFMQMAVAAYACPKLDVLTQDPAMPMASMVVEGPDVAIMPDCHAMADGMDEVTPQLCHAHCSGDSQPAPSVHAADYEAAAAQAMCVAYILPTLLDAATLAELRLDQAEAASGPGFPPLYLTLQVLRI